MQVETFECQIAKGQINRYLAGENFSAEGMKQLEEHIAKCEGCKNALGERKAALQKMLGTETPAPMAAVSMDAPIEVTKPKTEQAIKTEMPIENKAIKELVESGQSVKRKASEQVRSAVTATRAKAVKTAPGTYTKPLLYSVGLAAVLLTMNYVSRNSTKIFGEKAVATVGNIHANDYPLVSKPKADNMTPGGMNIGKVVSTTAAAKTSEMKLAADQDETDPVETTAKDSATKAAQLKPSAAEAKADNEAPEVVQPKAKISHRPVHINSRVTVRKIRRPARIRRHTNPVAAVTPDTVKVYDDKGKPVEDN